MPLKDI